MVTINRNRREHERQGKTRKVRDLKKRRSRSTWSRAMTWDRQGNLDFNRHERWKKEKRFVDRHRWTLADIQQDIHNEIQRIKDRPPQEEPVFIEPHSRFKFRNEK